jgi:predicted ester cyclase
MRPRDLIDAQINRLWGAGDTGVIPRIYDPGVVDHMPLPGQAGGLGPLGDVVTAFRTAIPDMTITVHRLLEDGPLAADFWTLEGHYTDLLPGMPPPSGQRLCFRGMDIVHTREGRITDIWHVEELALMTGQAMGAEPQPAGLPPLPQPGALPPTGSWRTQLRTAWLEADATGQLLGPDAWRVALERDVRDVTIGPIVAEAGLAIVCARVERHVGPPFHVMSAMVYDAAGAAALWYEIVEAGAHAV